MSSNLADFTFVLFERARWRHNGNEVWYLDTSTRRGENPGDFGTKSARFIELGNISFVG